MAISGKTGWIILGSVVIVATIAIIVVGINAVIDVKGAITDTFELPQDLKAHETDSLSRLLLISNELAPDDSVAVDSLSIMLFIASLDSSIEGDRIAGMAESSVMHNDSLRKEPLRVIGGALRADIRKQATTRRALVNFLNAHELSLDRYRWIKLHTIAAAGITRDEADSAVDAARRHHTSNSSAAMSSGELFDFVDAYNPTESEIRIATRYRERILENAVPDLEYILPYF